MTLAEFLLARIAEDEARARPQEDDESAISTLIVLGRKRQRRLLAECEAKRRIVSIAIEPDNQSMGSPMVDVLIELALVYADHPDYRDEWRP